jgi:phosphate transport system permease protein
MKCLSKLSEMGKDKSCLFFSSFAILTIILISLLFGTIFWIAYPVVSKTGIIEFISGSTWDYSTNTYGIWTFVMGTFIVTTMTMVFAIPLGLFTAIYLAEFAHPKVRHIMGTSIELLVGIPSVVYGIFGLFILKPFLKENFNPLIGSTLGNISPVFKDVQGSGEGMFLASIILTIMVIPTVISVSENSLRSVSRSYREASASLGATRWETIQNLVIPVALPGILAGITLGITRALGETMAIVMLTGNSKQIPLSVFDRGYAMTSLILNDIKYYFGSPEPTSALFGVAAFLFVIEAIFIISVRIISRIGARNA